MLKSTAHHEAGHMVVAVLQHMPLQDGGMHIDMEWSGVAYYCHRQPGVSDNSENSRDEREKTIVALFAGRIAQFNSLPGIDYRDYPDSWKSDWDTAAQLLRELYPSVTEVTVRPFYARAEQLVLRNWSTIESLALTLWEKPISPMLPSEIGKGWSQGLKRQEKSMSRSEVIAFFEKLHIPCCLWEDYRAKLP